MKILHIGEKPLENFSPFDRFMKYLYCKSVKNKDVSLKRLTNTVSLDYFELKI